MTILFYTFDATFSATDVVQQPQSYFYAYISVKYNTSAAAVSGPQM